MRVYGGVLLVALCVATAIQAEEPLVEEVNIRVNYAPPLGPPDKMSHSLFRAPEKGRYVVVLEAQITDPGVYERFKLPLWWGLSVCRRQGDTKPWKDAAPRVEKALARAPTLTQEFEADQDEVVLVAYYTTVEHRTLVGGVKGLPAPELLATVRITKVLAPAPETAAEEAPDTPEAEVVALIERYNAAPEVAAPAPGEAQRLKKECMGNWKHPQLIVQCHGILGQSARHPRAADQGAKCVISVRNRKSPGTTTSCMVYSRDTDGELVYRGFRTRRELSEELARLLREVE